MKSLFKFSGGNDLTEIVFANRNKRYGGYELRVHYEHRLRNAFLFIMGSLVIPLALGGLFFKSASMLPIVLNRRPVQVDTIQNIPVVMPPAQQAEEAPARSTNPFFARIVRDSALPHEKPDDKEDTMVVTSSTGSHGTLHGIPGSAGDSVITGKTGGTTTGMQTKAPDTTTVAQIMPQFPGGDEALTRYLNRYMADAYTDLAKDHHAHGKVFIQFVVSEQGHVVQVKVMADQVGFGCADAAADIVRHMPDWTPGYMGSRAVNVRMMVPVEFNTEDE